VIKTGTAGDRGRLAGFQQNDLLHIGSFASVAGTKRTSRFRGAMSAFDAVDGASSAPSKCYSSCVGGENDKGGEATVNVEGGAEDTTSLAYIRL
jgi:hypothetical protein